MDNITIKDILDWIAGVLGLIAILSVKLISWTVTTKLDDIKKDQEENNHKIDRLITQIENQREKTSERLIREAAEVVKKKDLDDIKEELRLSRSVKLELLEFLNKSYNNRGKDNAD